MIDCALATSSFRPCGAGARRLHDLARLTAISWIARNLLSCSLLEPDSKNGPNKKG